MTTAALNPFDGLGDGVQNILIWLFGVASNHPKTAGGIAAWFFLAFCVTNIVRGMYPAAKWAPADRPPLARALLGLFDPFALNLWTLVAWLLKKVGVTPIDPPRDLSASIRDAERQP